MNTQCVQTLAKYGQPIKASDRCAFKREMVDNHRDENEKNGSTTGRYCFETAREPATEKRPSEVTCAPNWRNEGSALSYVRTLRQIHLAAPVFRFR